MPAVLVSLTDTKTFLSVTGAADDDVLQLLLDTVEDQLIADTNRQDRPFLKDPVTGRVEVRRGTGTESILLDYPAHTITSIVLGYDPSVPDETLDPSDRTVVTWIAGKRVVSRLDGGQFGCVDAPNYLHITYNALPDVKQAARIAVLRTVATLYRQRGAEDTTRERLSSYERDMREVYKGEPIWDAAIRACWEPNF